MVPKSEQGKTAKGWLPSGYDYENEPWCGDGDGIVVIGGISTQW